MPLFTENEWVRKKIEEAADQKGTQAEKAEAIILAAVGVNAGLGFVPFAINLWTFLGVVAIMVSVLGAIYGYRYNHEDAAALVKQIFTAVGATSTALLLGLKFFTEVLKGVGVISLGGTTIVGMALDAVLCGAVTYAVGYTAKKYFENGRIMSEEQLRSEFRVRFKEGKSEVRRKTRRP